MCTACSRLDGFDLQAGFGPAARSVRRRYPLYHGLGHESWPGRRSCCNCLSSAVKLVHDEILAAEGGTFLSACSAATPAPGTSEGAGRVFER
jgi:hypothetical protein